MKLYIKDMAATAREMLLAAGDSCATVHSVYSRTLNLRLESGALLSLIREDTMLHPFAARLGCQEMEWLSAVNEGMQCLIQAGIIQLPGNISITWEEAAAQDLGSEHLQGGWPDPGILNMLYREAVGQAGGSALGFLLDGSQDSKLLPWKDQILRFTAAALAAKPEEAAVNGEPLIGLGWGLTPTCDDYMAGLLAALWAGKGYPREKLLALGEGLWARSAGRTTAVSAEFFRWAARGYFSRGILDLLACVLKDDAAGLPEAMRRLLSVGHSSGCDTLMGITCGLCAF